MNVSPLRRANKSGKAPEKVDTPKLDSEGLWVNAFRSNALLLSKLCRDYSISALSIDAPPNSWELAEVRNAFSILPRSVLEEIKAIGSASKQKLHKHAAIMRDEGIIPDDETIAALYMIANDIAIETAPVANTGVM